MRTYDDLRKTQAEVELQTKLRSVEPLHKSSNAASMKVAAAQQATPELPSQSPPSSAPDQEPEPQIPIAEPEPPQPWQVRKTADEQDMQARKADYAEAIKTNDFDRKEAMDKEMVERIKNFNYDGQDIKDFRSRVNHSYDAVSAYEKMDRAVTEKERKEFIGEEQHKLEKQHDWEQVQAKRAQIAAQNRGDRPARSGQDGPNRPGQAPEKPVKTQEPPRVAAATPDGHMVAQEREAMQRASRPQRLEPQTAPEVAKAPEKPERPQESPRAAPSEAAPDAGKRKLVFYEDRHAPTPEHQIKR